MQAPVLFLDVDGVLHPLGPTGAPLLASSEALLQRADDEAAIIGDEHTAAVVHGEFIAPCTSQLARIVAETGCRIVLSTTWRETPPQRRAVDAQLVAAGCPSSCDCTPRLSVLRGGRPAEILAYVREHAVTRWVELVVIIMRGGSPRSTLALSACSCALRAASLLDEVWRAHLLEMGFSEAALALWKAGGGTPPDSVVAPKSEWPCWFPSTLLACYHYHHRLHEAVELEVCTDRQSRRWQGCTELVASMEFANPLDVPVWTFFVPCCFAPEHACTLAPWAWAHLILKEDLCRHRRRSAVGGPRASSDRAPRASRRFRTRRAAHGPGGLRGLYCANVTRSNTSMRFETTRKTPQTNLYSYSSCYHQIT